MARGTEREILLTGIGGQGVQLAAKVLALAATREGRHVMSLGVYGGTMRGGNTESTVIVGDTPLVTPPVVSHAWSAVVAHPRYLDAIRHKLEPTDGREGGVVVYDEELAGAELELPGATLRGVAATRVAREADAPMGASLVLLGAFCANTGAASLESLCAAVSQALPPYRSAHIPANERALHAGFAALPRDETPAFVTAHA